MSIKLFLYRYIESARTTSWAEDSASRMRGWLCRLSSVLTAHRSFKLTELYSINIDHKRLHSFTLADVPAAARPCRRRRRLAAALTKPSVAGAVPALHRRRHSNLSQSCYCRYCVASFTILSTITGHAIDNLNTMCTLWPTYTAHKQTVQERDTKF